MLSEGHTLDDSPDEVTDNAEGDNKVVERCILSRVGSIIPASKEEDIPTTPDPREGTSDTLSTPTSPRLLDTDVVAQERSRMTRMSTNGTQVFTPSEDGIELDGLPVGPGRDVWVVKGKKRDSTYLM
jgi:hypothetical protein